jgi:hypothetical protein
MVILELQSGETRETTDPRVQLTLPGGVYIMTLVVEDEAGHKSAPVKVQFTVEGAMPA